MNKADAWHVYYGEFGNSDEPNYTVVGERPELGAREKVRPLVFADIEPTAWIVKYQNETPGGRPLVHFTRSEADQAASQFKGATVVPLIEGCEV